MNIQKFEDIIAWKKAQDFAIAICAAFSDTRDFSFKKQICSAAVFISNNITEGFDRNSDSDFE